MSEQESSETINGPAQNGDSSKSDETNKKEIVAINQETDSVADTDGDRKETTVEKMETTTENGSGGEGNKEAVNELADDNEGKATAGDVVRQLDVEDAPPATEKPTELEKSKIEQSDEKNAAADGQDDDSAEHAAKKMKTEQPVDASRKEAKPKRSAKPQPENSTESTKTDSKKVEPKKAAAKPPKTSPKKTPGSETADGEQEANDDGKDGKAKLGLLERPVEIQTGKRERKKVERLAEDWSKEQENTPKAQAHGIPEGSGVMLGDCASVEEAITKAKADDLKTLHRILFNTVGKTFEVKKNIRKFCGWGFEKDTAEYDRKLKALNKLAIPMLKQFCMVLALERTGTKDQLVQRILEYLLKPTDQSKKKAVPRVTSGKSSRSGKAKEHKDDQEEEENEEAESDASNSDKNESEADSEPEKLPAKKRKSAPTSKKTPSRSAAKPTAPTKRKAAAKNASESDEEGSTVEEPSAKRANRSPSDAEIKKTIQAILKNANLEQVTMKSVREQVIAKYPGRDLSNKKDFIKDTVKQILGA